MEDVGTYILYTFGQFPVGCWCFTMAIWYILRPFGTFYGHLVHFMVIWYIVPVLFRCTKKHLATPFGRWN
jgi:hypothetical protein